MRLFIIRHGDPDYTVDSLTEKGWREAEYLSERIMKLDVKEFYVSPLGRARDTASLTLKKLGRTGIECEWLREFEGKALRPDVGAVTYCWDWLPQDWTKDARFYHMDEWFLPEGMQAGNAKEEYDRVAENLDRLLSGYGYEREGRAYRVRQANSDTLVFFCHFAVGCVLISHLLSVSPMVLWQGFCAAPTSVAVLNTEERREGIASFRMSEYGDVSHLYAHGELPAFSARFCECWKNADERHD